MANQIQIQIEMPHLRGTFEGRRFAVVAREHRKTEFMSSSVFQMVLLQLYQNQHLCMRNKLSQLHIE